MNCGRMWDRRSGPEPPQSAQEDRGCTETLDPRADEAERVTGRFHLTEVVRRRTHRLHYFDVVALLEPQHGAVSRD